MTALKNSAADSSVRIFVCKFKYLRDSFFWRPIAKSLPPSSGILFSERSKCSILIDRNLNKSANAFAPSNFIKFPFKDTILIFLLSWTAFAI